MPIITNYLGLRECYISKTINHRSRILKFFINQNSILPQFQYKRSYRQYEMWINQTISNIAILKSKFHLLCDLYLRTFHF